MRFFSFLIVCVSIASIARSQEIRFNHQTVYVVDMNKSAEFYEKVMGLTRIEEPFHDNKHIWMKTGAHSQLHIVEGAKSVQPHDINIHMAFSVDSLQKFIDHLDSMQVKYGDWSQKSKSPQKRPDGILQIYLQDPDGYWIEVNNDRS